MTLPVISLLFFGSGVLLISIFVSLQLIERRGGKIWFETSPKGTSFFVEFKKGASTESI